MLIANPKVFGKFSKLTKEKKHALHLCTCLNEIAVPHKPAVPTSFSSTTIIAVYFSPKIGGP
jgi:hypothetical protein